MSKVVNKDINLYVEGYGYTRPYQGTFAFKPNGKMAATRIKYSKPGQKKVLENIREAIEKTNLKNNMTISFHHHLRDGDNILNLVMDEIAAFGIKNLTIHASSLTRAHSSLIKHIENGVVTGISTSGLRGKLGELQAEKNILGNPIIFRSHGGRARAIEAGEIEIDIAFIGASTCDVMGNMNGIEGKSAFGAMGYPMVDAFYADKVVVITDNLKAFPISNISIPMTVVDYIVKIDSIGDSTKIASGATRVTENPTELLIAKKTADILIALNYIKNGFSFQAGSGGSSLAVCKYLREHMAKNNIAGSFAAGGITNYLVDMLNDGLFNVLLDTQTFDALSVDSLKNNTNHIEMSSSMYANPHNKSCLAHQLDIIILSATEIDENFNLNSLTGSTGIIIGAIGGAPDTAAGAKLTVAVAPTMRNRIPIIVKRVTNIVTPGETVDLLVTERGICVNPKRKDIIDKLQTLNIEILSIEILRKEVEKMTGKPADIEYIDEVVGVIEYRDGSTLDLIYRIK